MYMIDAAVMSRKNFISLFLILALAATAEAGEAPACGAVKNGQVPNIWVQIGPARSASTIQYATLLLIGHLHCPKIFTSFVADNNVEHLSASQNNRDGLQIYKVHSIEMLSKASPMWLFCSDPRNISESDLSREINHPVEYVQRMSQLTKSTDSLISDYGKIFNLSPKDKEHLSDYIGYYSKLRQCCGSQASKRWRLDIIRKREDVSEHVCKSFDLPKIELDLQAFARRIGYPMLEYKPGFCACSINAIRSTKLNESSVENDMAAIELSSEMRACRNQYELHAPMETIPQAGKVISVAKPVKKQSGNH